MMYRKSTALFALCIGVLRFAMFGALAAATPVFSVRHLEALAKRIRA